MKKELALINKGFKEGVLRKLQSNRSSLTDQFKENEEVYLGLNKLQRFVAVHQYVTDMSFYRDEEILGIVKRLGLTRYTPKVFVCHLEFFDSLDEFQKASKYLYIYETIWGFYKLYSSSVIMEKMALDYDIDLSAIAGRVNRQINNKKFPPIFKQLIEDNKKLFDFVKKEIPDFKIDISDKNPITSTAHINKYSHKNELYNLYMYLKDNNIRANCIDFYEPDFKVEFYDLLVIVLREKDLIAYTDERIKDYKSLRRFKIKIVESLILS